AVLNALVGQASDELVLLNFPLDSCERANRLKEPEVLTHAVGLVDDAIAHVKFGVVLRVAQARTHEEVFVEGTGLDAIDWVARLRTSDRLSPHQRKDGHQTEPAEEPGLH